MRDISSSLRRSSEGHRRIEPVQSNHSTFSLRHARAAGVATLAPATIPSLPSFEGVLTEYNHEANAELLYELCAALATFDLANEEDWQAHKDHALAFAQSAILNGIGKKRNELLQRNVDYSLTICDTYERYGYGDTLEKGKLIVKIECGQSGYLEIGEIIEALEREECDLGAAFYWTLMRSLYRVLQVYGHEDAMRYEEGLREMAADDDEPNRDQYEFPEVRKSLPACIRRSLKHSKADRRRYKLLLRKHRDGAYCKWIGRLQRLEKLARLNVHALRNELDSYYDGPPVPSLLVAFAENDAIVACFDEEAQHMLESSPEPAFGLEFSPASHGSVLRVLRALDRFIEFNCELFRMTEEFKKSEIHTHAMRNRNRTERAVQAA
jgi:hypothetical protein